MMAWKQRLRIAKNILLGRYIVVRTTYHSGDANPRYPSLTLRDLRNGKDRL
jgi:hypothetical protein